MLQERTIRWTLASDRISRNSSFQQASLCLAFSRHVFDVYLDSTAVSKSGFRLCVRQLPAGDDGADWPNSVQEFLHISVWMLVCACAL